MGCRVAEQLKFLDSFSEISGSAWALDHKMTDFLVAADDFGVLI